MKMKIKVLKIVINDNFKKLFKYEIKIEKCYIHIYYNSRDAPEKPVITILNDFNTQIKSHIVIYKDLMNMYWDPVTNEVIDEGIHIMPSVWIQEYELIREVN